MMTYERYLKTEEWATIRDTRKELDNNACFRCGVMNVKLEVHHKTYERLGAELIDDLETLCVTCHRIETDKMRRSRYKERWYKRKVTSELREKKELFTIKQEKTFPKLCAHKSSFEI